MGKGPEYTFFQRRHTSVQLVYGKKFSTTNYQGNANQNRNKISPHRLMAFIKKKNKITEVGKYI